MDIAIAIISGVLGAGGLIGFVQFMITRHDKNNNELDQIKKELASIRNVQNEIITRVTRAELSDLIKDSPDNVDAILQVAEYYFIELDGNAYAHAMFEKWAKEHNVPIAWLPKLRKGAKNGTKLSQNQD